MLADHLFGLVCSAVQYALSKKVDVIVAAGNDNQNLDDPKFDSTSPDNGTIIYNRPVDLVSLWQHSQKSQKSHGARTCTLSAAQLRRAPRCSTTDLPIIATGAEWRGRCRFCRQHVTEGVLLYCIGMSATSWCLCGMFSRHGKTPALHCQTSSTLSPESYTP